MWTSQKSGIKMKRELQFGSETIAYDLDFSERKSLTISVQPDRSVRVKAPNGASFQKIKTKLEKNAPWILRQKDFFLSFEPRTPKRRYVNGESHLYLGRQYRLQIINSQEEHVKLSGGYFKVFTEHFENAEDLLKHWYSKKADDWFFKLASGYMERFERYGVQPESIKIRELKYRWGSCSPKKNILLNWELIKAPKACIEYVIVHELCHLVHPNHSKRFFKLQQKEFPQWKKWKAVLEDLLA